MNPYKPLFVLCLTTRSSPSVSWRSGLSRARAKMAKRTWRKGTSSAMSAMIASKAIKGGHGMHPLIRWVRVVDMMMMISWWWLWLRMVSKPAIGWLDLYGYVIIQSWKPGPETPNQSQQRESWICWEELDFSNNSTYNLVFRMVSIGYHWITMVHARVSNKNNDKQQLP